MASVRRQKLRLIGWLLDIFCKWMEIDDGNWMMTDGIGRAKWRCGRTTPPTSPFTSSKRKISIRNSTTWSDRIRTAFCVRGLFATSLPREQRSLKYFQASHLQWRRWALSLWCLCIGSFSSAVDRSRHPGRRLITSMLTVRGAMLLWSLLEVLTNLSTLIPISTRSRSFSDLAKDSFDLHYSMGQCVNEYLFLNETNSHNSSLA